MLYWIFLHMIYCCIRGRFLHRLCPPCSQPNAIAVIGRVNPTIRIAICQRTHNDQRKSLRSHVIIHTYTTPSASSHLCLVFLISFPYLYVLSLYSTIESWNTLLPIGRCKLSTTSTSATFSARPTLNENARIQMHFGMFICTCMCNAAIQMHIGMFVCTCMRKYI